MNVPDGLLPESAQLSLDGIQSSIEHSLRYGQLWRDPVEAACILSPLSKGATPQAAYWQATREQAVFARELIRLGFDYERKSADHELMQLDVEELATQQKPNEERAQRRVRAKLRARRADLEQCEWELGEMRRAAADRVRELVMWAEIKTKLEKAVPDTTCWWTGKEESMASLAVANLLSGRDPTGAIRDLVALGGASEWLYPEADVLPGPIQIAQLAAEWWDRVKSLDTVQQVLEQHLMPNWQRAALHGPTEEKEND